MTFNYSWCNSTRWLWVRYDCKQVSGHHVAHQDWPRTSLWGHNARGFSGAFGGWYILLLGAGRVEVGMRCCKLDMVNVIFYKSVSLIMHVHVAISGISTNLINMRDTKILRGTIGRVFHQARKTNYFCQISICYFTIWSTNLFPTQQKQTILVLLDSVSRAASACVVAPAAIRRPFISSGFSETAAWIQAKFCRKVPYLPYL